MPFEIETRDGIVLRNIPDGTPDDVIKARIAQIRGTPAAPAERTNSQELGRQVGLTARAALTGNPVSALGAMAGDALGMDSSGALQRFADTIGLPKPETATERVAQDVAGGMAGGAGSVKFGQLLTDTLSPVKQAIGRLLATGPGVQVVSGGTGAGAAGIARENDAGAGEQLAAGLAGGIAPSAAVAGGSAAVRGLVRGGELGRANMESRIRTFEEAGTMPSVGQASGNRAMQATESGLARVPGGAGPMVRAGEQQSAEMGARVNELADSLIPNASATKAGATIEKGLQRFTDRFKSEQGFLYNKLDAHIPAGSRVDVSNTRAALEQLNADIPGAPNVSELFKNSRIRGIEGALKADTETTAGVLSQLPAWQKQVLSQLPEVERTAMLNGLIDGKLPYEALKKLRTLVGDEIANTSLVSDVPRSKWKALYAALSDDLGEAAKAAGPDAEKAFGRANTYSRAGYERIGTYLDRVAGKDTVEKVFQAAVNPSELREGASTVNAVMRSLEPAERKMVQAAFLKRMGLATAGNQDETGGVFSAQTFLTNWNKVSPEARMMLFADGSGELRKNLDTLAQAAGMVKEGSKVFANPSGTSQAAANMATGAGLGAAVATGQLGTAGVILGGMAGANLTAKAMTNPRVVKWLAETTKMPPAALPAQLNVLAQIGARENLDLSGYISAVRDTGREGQIPR